MKQCTVTSDFEILEVNEDGRVILDGEVSHDLSLSITQFKGDKLEIWKYRADGYIFVYSNEIEIGYWVHPDLVRVERMIDGEKLLEEIKEMDSTLMALAENAEFEGYKHICDKFNSDRKSLQYAIGLIESGEYDIKEED